MEGGATLPQAPELNGSEQMEMPFAFYGDEEVAAALASRCAKLVFNAFSQCPLLVLLRS